jgi:hypothetical protein
MPSSVSVTSMKIGPGLTVTKTFTDVIRFSVDTFNEVLSITLDDQTTYHIDITTATTFTVTISGNNYTVVIS